MPREALKATGPGGSGGQSRVSPYPGHHGRGSSHPRESTPKATERMAKTARMAPKVERKVNGSMAPRYARQLIRATTMC
jgi:hypothetical protein